VHARGATGSGTGRGAWLCPGPDCVGHRNAQAALSRGLRAPLTDEDLARLRQLPEFGSPERGATADRAEDGPNRPPDGRR
jgi:predicted RNA-binding protein YlxR (DUF448 family)